MLIGAVDIQKCKKYLYHSKFERDEKMNERIKQFYIQTANETADGKEWAIGGLINAEKFAELIVEECMEVSLKYSHRDDDMGAIIAKQIKQHFGIEE